METNELLSKAVQESAADVFQKVASLTLQPSEEDFMNQGGEFVFSSIGFVGVLEGSVSLCMDITSARKILAKMLMMDMEDVTESDVPDGVGELANMLAGSVKMIVAQNGYNFEISIPTTLRGQQLAIYAEQGKETKSVWHFVCEDIRLTAVLIYKINAGSSLKEKIHQLKLA